MTKAEVQVRAATARKYLEVGELVMGSDPAERQVAGGLAVLAAIAASDAICGAVLGHAAQGPDHDQASDVLGTVKPDGAALAKHLTRVLQHKPVAHYGTTYLTDETVRSMLHHASGLVTALDAHVRR
jgi:hypothetical protein